MSSVLVPGADKTVVPFCHKVLSLLGVVPGRVLSTWHHRFRHLVGQNAQFSDEVSIFGESINESISGYQGIVSSLKRYMELSRNEVVSIGTRDLVFWTYNKILNHIKNRSDPTNLISVLNRFSRVTPSKTFEPY